MSDRDERAGEGRAVATDLGGAADETVSRAESQGEADEPNAPTAEQENAGMSTVLDADPLFGVQPDASDE